MKRRRRPVQGEIPALVEEGHDFLCAGDFRQALRKLERAWALTLALPERPSFTRPLGRLLIEACLAGGRPERLDRHALGLLEAGVREPPVLAACARAFLAGNRRDDPVAVQLFLDVLAAGKAIDRPLQEEILRALSVALEVNMEAGPAEARPLVPALERLHALRPGLAFPALQLGRYHYLRGDYPRARGYLMGLKGSIARSPHGLNLLARCSEKMGDLDHALATYKASLGADPLQPHVHYRIGRILVHEHVAARLS